MKKQMNLKNIGPSLAKNIPDSSMSFESLIHRCRLKVFGRVNTNLPGQFLSINELKDTIFL